MENKIMILGSGPVARNLAGSLITEGIPVVMACRDPEAAAMGASFQESHKSDPEVISDATVQSCTGVAGDFSVELASGNLKIERHVRAVILSEESVRESNASRYSLPLFPRIIPLSRLRTAFESPDTQGEIISSVKTCLFLNGLIGESHPEILREVMHFALLLQREYQIRSHVFVNNLKVAGDGLEALYRETRIAGVIYTKVTESSVIMEKTDEGRIRLTYFDEPIRLTLTLLTDLIIIDEKAIPSGFLMASAQKMGLETGLSGFAQKENVHRLPVATNRKGILVVGDSRGGFSKKERDADTASAMLALTSPRVDLIPLNEKARIHEGRCIRCLTCFRACPYHAILLNPRPVVALQACEGCGICMAECPRDAINLGVSSKETIPGYLNEPSLSILAFCCTRSAIPALELASLMGYPVSKTVSAIRVPCAGKITPEEILMAFKGGADGVMVITCHQGNCHSEKGNRLAKDRVGYLKHFLKESGIGEGRLIYCTLASNMGSEAWGLVRSFESVLSTLGRTPLNRERPVI
ncbi:MAG: hydrogenase iron-sulfur subunit [Thermodesulfobacteriota bacterium]